MGESSLVPRLRPSLVETLAECPIQSGWTFALGPTNSSLAAPAPGLRRRVHASGCVDARARVPSARPGASDSSPAPSPRPTPVVGTFHLPGRASADALVLYRPGSRAATERVRPDRRRSRLYAGRMGTAREAHRHIALVDVPPTRRFCPGPGTSIPWRYRERDCLWRFGLAEPPGWSKLPRFRRRTRDISSRSRVSRWGPGPPDDRQTDDPATGPEWIGSSRRSGPRPGPGATRGGPR